MKKVFQVLLLLLAVMVVIFLAVRFFFGGLEDTWICENGQWIEHGHPAVPQPTLPCQSSGQTGIACDQRSLETCNEGCAVCPPCPECSSIACQEESKCQSMGFAADWYQNTQNPGNVAPGSDEPACKNVCGDGTCQEVVCMAVGCPCAESQVTCPQDCK